MQQNLNLKKKNDHSPQPNKHMAKLNTAKCYALYVLRTSPNMIILRRSKQNHIFSSTSAETSFCDHILYSDHRQIASFGHRLKYISSQLSTYSSIPYSSTATIRSFESFVLTYRADLLYSYHYIPSLPQRCTFAPLLLAVCESNTRYSVLRFYAITYTRSTLVWTKT